jgi:hypothetical protein
MGKNRAIWGRHPLWSVYLLMAADAEKTGLTAESAKVELKRLMPSIGDGLDDILAAQGDLDRMNGVLEAQTALTITDEAHTLGADVPRHRGNGEPSTDIPAEPEEPRSEDFTAQLRRELMSKRQTVARDMGQE